VCGICGFIDGRGLIAKDRLEAAVNLMMETLANRGPDGSGLWTDRDAGVAFGHRRLAILDLTTAGRQPMISADGRMIITFNGEIYNYREIRAVLERKGHRFGSNSDTEVLLEACRAWGVEAAARRLNGIFAFAIWDRAERTLSLVRDHIGVKPLYWAQRGNFFMFGSQLKALRTLPGWIAEIDRDAVEAFQELGYVPGTATIYRDVHKLFPGTILTWKPGSLFQRSSYWDFKRVAEAGFNNQIKIGIEDAAVQLETLLRHVIKDQMISDVPLGAFLSGGIDSSTIAALMQAQSSSQIKTFSIGFFEHGANEAEYAKAVARHLGTDHTEFYCEPTHALEVIPKLPELFDEPFADPSQIPTFILSEITRSKVTVALSGDGGDELFAGYARYLQKDLIYKLTHWAPRWMRRLAAQTLISLDPLQWNALARTLGQDGDSAHLGHRLYRLSELLRYETVEDLCLMRTAGWQNSLVLGSRHSNESAQFFPANKNLDPISRFQIFESVSWLPEDVLAKVDRASMAVGLEARVPLLDPRLVEFAWRLPAGFKVYHNKGKRLLRKVLHRYVPRHLVERPKMGFGMPIGTWVRGPLRDWSEDLLDQKKLTQDGIFDPASVRRLWDEHYSGARNWQDALWHILMFQAWYQRWHRTMY